MQSYIVVVILLQLQFHFSQSQHHKDISTLLSQSYYDNTFEACRSKGECFGYFEYNIMIYNLLFYFNFPCSGAWFGTMAHLLNNTKLAKFFPHGIIDKQSVRCEDASFFFFHNMFDYRFIDTLKSSPVHTIDLIDFFGTKSLIVY
jgi:hypothetical protein